MGVVYCGKLIYYLRLVRINIPVVCIHFISSFISISLTVKTAFSMNAYIVCRYASWLALSSCNYVEVTYT